MVAPRGRACQEKVAGSAEKTQKGNTVENERTTLVGFWITRPKAGQKSALSPIGGTYDQGDC